MKKLLIILLALTLILFVSNVNAQQIIVQHPYGYVQIQPPMMPQMAPPVAPQPRPIPPPPNFRTPARDGLWYMGVGINRMWRHNRYWRYQRLERLIQ